MSPLSGINKVGRTRIQGWYGRSQKTAGVQVGGKPLTCIQSANGWSGVQRAGTPFGHGGVSGR